MAGVLVPRHVPGRIRRRRTQGVIILVMLTRSVHREGRINLGNKKTRWVNILPKLRLPQDHIVAVRVMRR